MPLPFTLLQKRVRAGVGDEPLLPAHRFTIAVESRNSCSSASRLNPAVSMAAWLSPTRTMWGRSPAASTTTHEEGPASQDAPVSPRSLTSRW